MPDNYSVDLSGLDLSPEAINSRLGPAMQAAELQRQQDEAARAEAIRQSYLDKAGGDEILARQLRAQDIIASNNARGVDPASTEREVWSILNGDKDYATDPSSPYKVRGRDFNWGIAAALLAPAFAAQFGLLGAGAGSTGGAGAAASGGLGELIAANNAYMATFAPGAIAGTTGVGTLVGNAGADMLGGAVNAGNFAITPAITAANAAALGGTAGATTVAELVVTAAQAGMTVPQIAAALAVPAVTVAAIALSAGVPVSWSAGPGNGPVDATVDEVVIEGAGTSPSTPFNPLTVTPAVLPAVAPQVPTNVPDLTPTNTGTSTPTLDPYTPAADPLTVIPPVLPSTSPQVPTNVPDLKPTDTSTLGVDPSLTDKLLDWAKAHPAEVLGLLGGVAGTAGSGSGTSGGTAGKYTLQNPLFKAQLPTAQGFAVRTPTNVQTDWNRYGMGPEASFFSTVPDLYPRNSLPAYQPPASPYAVNPTSGYSAQGNSGYAITPTAPRPVTQVAPTVPKSTAVVPTAPKPVAPVAAKPTLAVTPPVQAPPAPAKPTVTQNPNDPYTVSLNGALPQIVSQLANKLVPLGNYQVAEQLQAAGVPQGAAVETNIGTTGGLNPEQFAAYMDKIDVPDNYAVPVTGPYNPFESYGYTAKDVNKDLSIYLNYDENGNLGNLGIAGDNSQLPVNFYEGWQKDFPDLKVKLTPDELAALKADFEAQQKQRFAEHEIDVRKALAGQGRTDYPGYDAALGYKKGGYAVTGPGTGRSDSIAAKLSDGEYVIDAETVALLGDGSSKAGADQLDKFRVNIRKHKGRALSKGKFSTNAKAPEAYLAGGRR